MTKGRYHQVDTETGEIIEGYNAVITPKRRNGFGTRWVAVNQDPLEIFATSSLRGDDFRVLFLMMSRLEFENYIVTPQVEVAETLGLRPQHVNKSIKRLKDMEALLEGPKMGHFRSYKLNPEFGWKGSAKNHNKALEERRKVAGLRLIDGGIGATV